MFKLTIDELKGRFNNRFINEAEQCIGKVIGIELDFDTVCFAIEKEDNSIIKKYVVIKNLNTIITSHSKDKSLPIEDYDNFIKTSYRNSENSHSVRNLGGYHSIDDALRHFINEEKKNSEFYSPSEPFSMWCIITATKCIVSRKNKDEVAICYSHGSGEHIIVKKIGKL